jgi:hypothetical protein
MLALTVLRSNLTAFKKNLFRALIVQQRTGVGIGVGIGVGEGVGIGVGNCDITVNIVHKEKDRVVLVRK